MCGCICECVPFSYAVEQSELAGRRGCRIIGATEIHQSPFPDDIVCMSAGAAVAMAGNSTQTASDVRLAGWLGAGWQSRHTTAVERHAVASASTQSICSIVATTTTKRSKGTVRRMREYDG